MAPSLSPGILTSIYHGYQKSSSPQRPGQDMQIIYAVFAGSVIIKSSGKISTIFPVSVGNKKSRAIVDPTLDLKDF
jgi:hypothetical protein